MRELVAVLALVLASGCGVTVPKPTVTIPPITIPGTTGTKGTTAQGCGCDLAGARLQPPYTDEQLVALGNAAECPVTFAGKDIRLAVVRPDGNAWLIGMLCSDALTVQGDTFSCHCFTKPEGRYHYLGWSKSDLPKDIIAQKPGTVNRYEGTVFVSFELRAK